MEKQFIQKNGRAINIIARDILTLSDGAKLRTIADYEKQLACSRWTIQTAFQFLQENNCFRLETVGSKGSFVSGMNRKLLFEYAGWHSFLGLLPLASTHINEALYTGIVDAMSRAELPINFAFMLPASKRFEMLSTGQCQFILTSRLAWKIYSDKYDNLVSAMELSDSLYCAPYKLYTMQKDVNAIVDGLRVGIYDAAIEQKYITEKLCDGKNVDKIYGNYQDCQIMLESGEIDVLVQRGDLTMAPFNSCESYQLDDMGIESDITTPIIIVNKADYGIADLLKAEIDQDLISVVQKSVLLGKRHYSYF